MPRASSAKFGWVGMAAGGEENPSRGGALYLMLQNRIYLGETTHKGSSYPGEHEAIVNLDLWEKANEMLAARRVSKRAGGDSKNSSLLAGILYDGGGERMTPSHAVKKGKRYRYYVSNSLITKNKSASPSGLHIPAGEIEQIVLQRLQAFFSNRSEVFDAIRPHIKEAAEQKRLLSLSAALSKGWSGLPPKEMRRLFLALTPRTQVHPEKVDIHIAPGNIAGVLRENYSELPSKFDAAQKESHLILSIPARLKRSGKEMKMLIDGEAHPGGKKGPEPGLLRLIARAHYLKEKLISGGSASLREIARREKVESSYFTRIVRLTYLAPDITKAILDGRQPPEFTASRLMRDTRFPLDWKEQKKALGLT